MKDFFEQLYQFCDEGVIELRSLPSKKRLFVRPDEFQEIEIFCHDNNADNLYFGIATRDGQGGGKENIVQIPCLWVDIDFKDIRKEIVKEKIRSFPFKPSIWVSSGGGIHLYWILKEPSGKQDIRRIEDVNCRIAAALNGDLNACDAARILRVPGTVNRKYSTAPLCKVIRFDEFFFDVEAFVEILPKIPKTTEQTPSGKKGWLAEAMAGCKRGNRNATAARLVGYWHNRLSVDDTLLILSAWNRNNDPSLPEDELKSVVKSVSRYESKKKSTRSISVTFTPRIGCLTNI
jgi:hypothetical protein